MASNSTPNDPGNPDNTNPEATSPEAAEQAAADAQADAQANAAADVQAEQAGEIDPELAAEIDEALAGVDAEVNPDADGDGEVTDLEAKLAERTEDLQRVTAEYANYRRRTTAERESVVANAKASVITALLPLLDDLDLARQHGDLDDGTPLKGFADKLTNILEGQKLTPFGETGEAFDPEIHEAVQDLSSGEDKALGTVLRKGYRVGDRLIRNAMVIIADPVTTAEAGEEPATDAE